MKHHRPTARAPVAAAAILAVVSAFAAGCGGGGQGATAGGGAIVAVGAENEYANVIEQVGGTYVTVTRDREQPEHRPAHLRGQPERRRRSSAPRGWSSRTASATTRTWNRIESASPSSSAQGDRRAEAARAAGLHAEPAPLVQAARRCPRSRRRSPPTCRRSQPAHAAVLPGQRRRLRRLADAVACRRSQQFARDYPDTPVATTEPVGDYMLEAAGTVNLTPFALQADVMNGVDPAPQDVTLQNSLFADHRVKVFVYNQQVTDSLTAVVPRTPPSAPACPWSACTRRCRRPATTTSRGCWPR